MVRTAAVERDLSIRVRVSADEHRMLHELSEAMGVSASDYVRLAIRQAYASADEDRKAKKKSKK